MGPAHLNCTLWNRLTSKLSDMISHSNKKMLTSNPFPGHERLPRTIEEKDITDSNYDRDTLILQQGLRQNFTRQIKLNKAPIRFWGKHMQRIQAPAIALSLVVLPELLGQQEATLCPGHKNQAMEQASRSPWKMKNLQLLHERSLTMKLEQR